MQKGTIKKAVAGLVVATASVATLAGPAFASPNNGGYKRSSEGLKHQYVDPCPGIWNTFEKDVNSAQTAHDAGNTQSMNGFLSLAAEDLKAGQLAGCDWAARVAVPTFAGTTTTAVVATAIR